MHLLWSCIEIPESLSFSMCNHAVYHKVGSMQLYTNLLSYNLWIFSMCNAFPGYHVHLFLAMQVCLLAAWIRTGFWVTQGGQEQLHICVEGGEVLDMERSSSEMMLAVKLRGCKVQNNVRDIFKIRWLCFILYSLSFSRLRADCAPLYKSSRVVPSTPLITKRTHLCPILFMYCYPVFAFVTYTWRY